MTERNQINTKMMKEYMDSIQKDHIYKDYAEAKLRKQLHEFPEKRLKTDLNQGESEITTESLPNNRNNSDSYSQQPYFDQAKQNNIFYDNPLLFYQNFNIQPSSRSLEETYNIHMKNMAASSPSMAQKNMMDSYKERSIPKHTHTNTNHNFQETEFKQKQGFSQYISNKEYYPYDNTIQNKSEDFYNQEELSKWKSKILDFFNYQNQKLMELKKQNDSIYEGVNQMKRELKELRNALHNKKSGKSDSGSIPLIYQNHYLGGNIRQSSGKNDLNGVFLKKSPSDYQYRMILTKVLEKPLFKEKNFSLSILLVNKDDQPVLNANKIPISVSLFTTETPPQQLDLTNNGKQILQGITTKELFHGVIIFQQLQIQEVTSHLRNGYVSLVIAPVFQNDTSSSDSNTDQDNSQEQRPDQFIQLSDIRPLIIEQVKVKAKIKQNNKISAADQESIKESKEEVLQSDNNIEQTNGGNTVNYNINNFAGFEKDSAN